jgi:hypothetical protein
MYAAVVQPCVRTPGSMRGDSVHAKQPDSSSLAVAVRCASAPAAMSQSSHHAVLVVGLACFWGPSVADTYPNIPSLARARAGVLQYT